MTAGMLEKSGESVGVFRIGSRTVATGSQGSPRARLLLLAVLVIFFATFYAYLDASGSCGDPGCPHFSQGHASASSELPAAPLLVAALTVAAPTVLAGRALAGPASDRKPTEVYLSPEPEPPRSSRSAGRLGGPRRRST